MDSTDNQEYGGKKREGTSISVDFLKLQSITLFRKHFLKCLHVSDILLVIGIEKGFHL